MCGRVVCGCGVVGEVCRVVGWVVGELWGSG